ncbi:MAG: SUF system NifU family Fe-S cluster assembly protein [Acidimicrobiaceae bacterium]|nr:SUF system NifU family Fe-S cluster assembly protein [Acidimicrobiaceae bacterium]
MNGLEDLYREIILDHYKNPRNQGELPVPPAHAEEGHNPLCGDEVIVYVEIGDGKVKDIKIGGQGCSISRSSASMMTTAVKGRTIEEVDELIHRFKVMMSLEESDGSKADPNAEVSLDEFGELAALQGVVKFPVRIKCATLPWNTLDLGIKKVLAG